MSTIISTWDDSQNLLADRTVATPPVDEVSLLERWAGTGAMAVIGLALMTVLMF